MKAPAGAEVGLYMDTRREIFVGDEIRTPTGRRYLVVRNRIQDRGKHLGRQHLRAVVLADDAPHAYDRDPDATTHCVVWYKR